MIDMTDEQASQKIMMSPTFQKLAQLAPSMPMSTQNPESFKSMLSTCSIELADALDHGRIRFESDSDHAMLMGLLVAAVDYVLDGGLKSNTARASVN